MNTLYKVMAASLGATFTPAIILGLFSWYPPVIAIASVVSFLHVAILGVPAIILGYRLRKIRLWSIIVMAFFIGALPTAIYTWPLGYPELHSTSTVWGWGQTMINGIPTISGWLVYISGFSFMGLFGISGGIAFWLIWQYWPYR